MTENPDNASRIGARRKALFLGSMSAVIQSLLGILIVGIGLPVLLTTLGRELYGVFAVVSVVSTLGTITSAGISGALIFHVGGAESRAGANHAILGNLALSIILGLLVFAGGLLFESTILQDVFSLVDPLARSNVILYRYLLVCGVLTTVGQPFVALLDVQQKNHLSNFSQFIYTSAYWSLCTVFAAAWHSLEALAYAVFIATALWFVLVVVLAIRFWGRMEISGNWRSIGKASVSQIRYGSQLFLAQQMVWLYEPFTKVLIANTLGMGSVTTFDIAVRVKNQVWSVFAKMIYPINPLLASLKSNDQLKLLVVDTSRIIFLVMVPISVSFALVTKPFYVLWLGTVDQDLILATVLITCGHFLSLVGLPMYHFSVARGFPKHVLIVHLGSAIVNAGVFLSCYRILGFVAAPIANAAATLLSIVYFLSIQRARFGLVFPEASKTFLQAVAVALGCAVLGVVLKGVVTYDIAAIVLVPSLLAAVTITLYRWQNVFDPLKLTLYLGDHGKLAEIAQRLLCRRRAEASG
jgi:O-antigen/teichoic acid export membrane protein